MMNGRAAILPALLTHRDGLAQLKLQLQVSIVVEEVVSRVEATQWRLELEEATAAASKHTQACADAQKAWREESNAMGVESGKLKNTLTSLHQTHQTYDKRVSELRDEVSVVQSRCSTLQTTIQARKVKADVTALPPLALESMCSGLRGEDIANAILVCHRWKRVLVGAGWRAVLMQKHLNNAKRKRAEEERQKMIVVPPKMVSVTINDIKGKKSAFGGTSLKKDVIFDLCLKHVGVQLAKAWSVRDDLSQRAHAEGEVVRYLEQTVAAAREALGTARLAAAKWQGDTQGIAKLKQDIAQEIGELEAAIKTGGKRKQAMEDEMEAALTELSHKIKLAKEMDTYAQDNPEEDQNSEQQQLILQAKKDKKQLVGAVKMLRMQLQQAVREKEGLQFQTLEAKAMLSH